MELENLLNLEEKPDGMEHKDEEKLCHVFASAVLYPLEMPEKELHYKQFHFYENELIHIKERWGISISAIFQTALRLEIINDYVFRNLNINYRSSGYHKDNNEPGNFLLLTRGQCLGISKINETTGMKLLITDTNIFFDIISIGVKV